MVIMPDFETINNLIYDILADNKEHNYCDNSKK